MGKISLRLQCSLLFAAPVLAIWAAPVIRDLVNEPPVEWLRKAMFVHLSLSVFLVVAPFLVEFLTRRQYDRIEPMAVDLDLTLLLMGLGGVAFVSWGAAILFGFGESTEYLFGCVAFSFAIGTYWGWRLRHALR